MATVSRAFLVEVPVIIKSREAQGRRLVSVEASNEAVDSEGDVILQRALLDAAPAFIRGGHIDIDHISEIGDQYGIPDPSSYIVGRPTEVNDLGKGRTEVVAEIFRSADGSVDPKTNKYDEFWNSLQTVPSVPWRASIYGFPKSGMIDDCRSKSCALGATRYLVHGIDWRSLAFTRTPINDAIQRFARIISMKAFIDELIKGGPGAGMAEAVSLSAPPPPPPPPPSDTMDELWHEYTEHFQKSCPWQHPFMGTNLTALKNHFTGCRGMGYDQADIYAHAIMHKVYRGS